MQLINPFLPNIPILLSLKTPGNPCFYGAFRDYKMGILGRNGLSNCMKVTTVLKRFNPLLLNVLVFSGIIKWEYWAEIG